MKTRTLLVGMNADIATAPSGQPEFLVVPLSYCDRLREAGASVSVLPPTDSPADIDEFLARVAAVVFIGGADLDSRTDGYCLHPAMRLMHPRREACDRALMAAAVAARKPLLAIGAGCQLLNVICGGTLFYHIPEDLPAALRHWDRSDPAHSHAMMIAPRTFMATVFGTHCSVRVTSQHHMAIDEPAPGFVVSARSLDGVVEAIEYAAADWCAVGVQFHPEAAGADAIERQVIAAFVSRVAGRPWRTAAHTAVSGRRKRRRDAHAA